MTQVVRRLHLCDHRINNGSGGIAMSQGQVHAGHQFVGGAAGSHLSCVEQYQVIGQPGDFVWRVAHVQHGNGQLGMQPLQVGQYLSLALPVECSQRLVHQQ